MWRLIPFFIVMVSSSGCDAKRSPSPSLPSGRSTARPVLGPNQEKAVEPYRVTCDWNETAWTERLTGWPQGWNEPDPTRGRWTPELAGALREDTAEVLDLYNVPLTDEIRSLLMPLRNVRWLRMSANVTATDVVWIGQMTQLRGLSLAYADLTRADLRALASLQSLQFLDLQRAVMTNREFASLPRLVQLQTLWLEGRGVTDQFLEHLVEIELPALRSAGLVGTSITDQGLARFCSLYNLECLDISLSRGVSKHSIAAISRMSKLRKLAIWETGIVRGTVINEDVKRLKQLLPDCAVSYAD